MSSTEQDLSGTRGRLRKRQAGSGQHLTVPTKKLTFTRSKGKGKTEPEIHNDNHEECKVSDNSLNNPASIHGTQHQEPLKVKRKSRTAHGNRKKRNPDISSGSESASTVDVDCKDKLENVISTSNQSISQKEIDSICAFNRAHTSTPIANGNQSRHSGLLNSIQCRKSLHNFKGDDTYTDFWNDDQVFAEFDLSDVVKSCESPKTRNACGNQKDIDHVTITSGQEHLDKDNNTSAGQEKLNPHRSSGSDNLVIDIISETVSWDGQEFGGHSRISETTDRKNYEGGTFYGLPMKVKEMLSVHRGIEKLYEWQETCLQLPAIKERTNLIYSLPTSGGKTLVAEILMMRELLINSKDVMLVVPFVSIVQEKVRTLAQFAVDFDFVVEEYAASKGKYPPRKRKKKRALYVATIEKANALVNSLIEEQRMASLGLVVVDELHMLGEGGGRGATLEMCLTKLLFSASHVQLIGMSATLSNIADLQQFLLAEVYSNDFRPVELHEYVKIETAVYEVPSGTASYDPDVVYQQVRHVRHKQTKDQRQIKDPDHLVPLIMEVVPHHSCLVFCATKRNCENVAKIVVEFMPRELREVKSAERLSLLKALYIQANGLCPVLKITIPYGIAYHHSGLTMDERKLIEDAYSQGVLCVLTCTSTLAAGVNLPAKRVILRAPYIGRSILSRSQYKQMVGRAGRAGIDSSGESILILKNTDKTKVGHLFSGPYDSCHSSLLYQDSKGIRTLILTLLGLKLCTSQTELASLMARTLMAVQADSQFDAQQRTADALQTLVSLGHIKEVRGEHVDLRIEVTKLGYATYKGCLDVDATPAIYKDIKCALETMVLLNELHLLYLVTPLDQGSTVQPDWMVYQRQVASLSAEEQKAASTIGVTDLYLLGRVYGRKIGKCQIDETVVRRFHLTLMLYKLMQGRSIWCVADVFQVPRGFVQSLLTSAASYASCLVHFTEELSEFWAIKLLLEAMVKKLSYTASLELIPLMEVPGVKQARARQLFNAGYRTLGDLAWAEPGTLVDQIEHLARRQAHQIVSAAKMLLNEKADALREEAEEMVAVP